MLLLMPSKIQGVGVFTTEPIKEGEALKLFTKDDWKFRKKLTELESKYCIKDEGGWHGPANFMRMSIGWYLNSSTKPNVEVHKYRALRYIKAGEELTIDYRDL